MSDEKRVEVTVEAVGEIRWDAQSSTGDPRWNDSLTVARVIDADGNRYIVNGRQCFRNGTTINDSIIGLKAAIEVYRFTPISFNCPTMFGKRGL